MDWQKWATSSAGRALRSQCRGRGFDPPVVHQLPSGHPRTNTAPSRSRLCLSRVSSSHPDSDRSRDREGAVFCRPYAALSLGLRKCDAASPSRIPAAVAKYGNGRRFGNTGPFGTLAGSRISVADCGAPVKRATRSRVACCAFEAIGVMEADRRMRHRRDRLALCARESSRASCGSHRSCRHGSVPARTDSSWRTIAARESSLSTCPMVDCSVLASAVRSTAVDINSSGIRNATVRPRAIPAAAKPPIRWMLQRSFRRTIEKIAPHSKPYQQARHEAVDDRLARDSDWRAARAAMRGRALP